MSAEAWNNQYIELSHAELLESCIEMTKMLDQVASLVEAFKKTGDERLLDVVLDMIGVNEDEEGEGDEDDEQ